MIRHLPPPARLTVLAIAACSLLLAACGASSNTPTTAAGKSRGPLGAQAQQAMLRFTGCMRSNGVPGFQDQTGEIKSELAPGAQPSPAFLAAYRTCQNLMPGSVANSFRTQLHSDRNSPAQKAGALAFARCMRSHGFPNFPDPNANGQLTHEMLAAAGIDIHQPAVIPAADACVGASNGFITKAIVARFVAEH